MNEKKTNLKQRIIPVILFSNFQVLKSRNFSDSRVVGSLEQTINIFNTRDVDEIIILDIESSKKKTGINLDVLKIISRNSTMPITYGGGVSSVQDIENCLKNGCDKVSINSKSIEDIKFIKKSSRVFGSQCIVSSVDYLKKDNLLKLYSHSNCNVSKIDLFDYIMRLYEGGTGELIITDVDNDGMMKGYDTSLYDKIKNKIDIPVIINGGCGKPEDLLPPLSLGVNGVALSSIFYYSKYSYIDIKKFLKNKNKNIRI
jgi:cyclase